MAVKTRIPNLLIAGLQRVMSPFEDLTGTDRPLWRDYSRYDLDVNLDVAFANGVSGAAFRYAMGWGGTDDTFPGRWSQAGDLDYFYRTGYSVLYPSLDLERQVDHWFKLIPKIDTIPRVLDAELQDGQTDAKVGEAIWKTWKMIESYDGIAPIVYSRYLLIDKWLRYWPQEDLDKVFIWGARYLWDRTREHAGPPYGTMNYVNIPAENWILHQTADKKAPFPGETGRSTIVDWDRWELGTEDQMHQWIKNTWGKPEIPPTPPTLEDRVTVLEVEMDNVQEWIGNHG